MMKASILVLAGALTYGYASSVSIERCAASGPIWPSQHYQTENFTAPDMAVWQDGDTASGFLFLTPAGNGTDVNAPVFITDSNELVWWGPGNGFTYNNFKVQQLHDQDALTTW